MKKKIMAMAILAPFLAIEWSCGGIIYRTDTVPPEPLIQVAKNDTQILGVVLKSGQEVRFRDTPGAVVIGDVIAAFSFPAKSIRAVLRQEEIIRRVPGRTRNSTRALVTKTGMALAINTVQKEKGQWIIEGFRFDTIIPLSEVKMINIRSRDSTAMFFFWALLWGFMVWFLPLGGILRF